MWLSCRQLDMSWTLSWNFQKNLKISLAIAELRLERTMSLSRSLWWLHGSPWWPWPATSKLFHMRERAYSDHYLCVCIAQVKPNWSRTRKGTALISVKAAPEWNSVFLLQEKTVPRPCPHWPSPSPLWSYDAHTANLLWKKWIETSVMLLFLTLHFKNQNYLKFIISGE